MRYIIHLFDNQFINPAADCASVADANCNSGKVVPFVCEDLRAEDELETMSRREKLSTDTAVGSTFACLSSMAVDTNCNVNK